MKHEGRSPNPIAKKIRLAYANRLEPLLELLAARLDAPLSRVRDIFQPTFLLVPNRGVETWLKLALAERLGIVSNLHCPTLFRFLRDLLHDDEGTTSLRVADKEVLRLALLELLADDRVLEQPDLTPVRRYLGAVADDPPLLEMRRFQLATRLAVLFEEYRFARPAMVAAWPERSTLPAGTWADTERWQRALWLAITGPDGVLQQATDRHGVDWVFLEQVLADPDRAELLAARLPARLHVFGLTHVSRAFLSVFAQLAQHCELYLYALNPCMEYWEDVAPRWQADATVERFPLRRPPEGPPRLDDEDPFDLVTTEENPILQLWGRPGRESIRLLDALTECDFDGLFVDPRETSSSVLAHLQQDVLFRTPARGRSPDGPPALALDDDSIRVLACPSMQREVEVVAARIWASLHADEQQGGSPPLRLNDIAVLVPHGSRDAYLPRLHAVFAETHDIPFNAVDLPAAIVSRVVEAVGLLLALPLGTFTREQVLALVTHPNVAAAVDDAHGAAPTDAWVRWCDALGIVHGADHTDHADTYIDLDVFNWDQGLRRLALGVFMDTDSPNADLVELDGRKFAPFRGAAADRDGVASFIRLVRRLIAAARHQRSAQLSLGEWGKLLAAHVARHVAAVNDADQHVLDRCLRTLEDLAEVEPFGAPVGFRVAHAVATERIAALETRRGQYLADGVVVSTLLPMRALPFRVVFVLGMGEGSFPAADPRSPLDLRGARWHVGDITPRERDMYCFLETLVTTRDRIVLSYVARDDQTGEPLAASNVLDELVAVLRRGYLSEEAAERLVEVHPLRRYDVAGRPQDATDDVDAVARLAPFGLGDDVDRARPEPYLPQARGEARAAALRRDFGETLGMLPHAGDRLIRNVSSRARTDLEHLLRIVRVEDTSARVVPPSMHLSTLRRFLESPLQGAAAWLGLDDARDQDDLVAREDEAFHAERQASAILLRDVFAEALTTPEGLDGAQLAAIYQRRIERLTYHGHFPIGPFGAAQRTRDLATLAAWRQNVRALELPRRGPFTRTVFGQGPQDYGPEWLGRPVGPIEQLVTLPPLLLRVSLEPEANAGSDAEANEAGKGQREVALHGLTGLCFASRGGEPPGIVLLRAAGAIDAADFLSGFLDHVALCAAGLAEPQGTDVLVVSTARLGEGAWVAHWPAIAVADAQAYLADLLADLVRGPHDLLLPIEAVCDALLEEPPKDLAQRIRDYRDDPWSTARFTRGPIRDVQAFEPPPNAEALAHRRLGRFLQGVAFRRPLSTSPRGSA